MRSLSHKLAKNVKRIYIKTPKTKLLKTDWSNQKLLKLVWDKSKRKPRRVSRKRTRSAVGKNTKAKR